MTNPSQVCEVMQKPLDIDLHIYNWFCLKVKTTRTARQLYDPLCCKYYWHCGIGLCQKNIWHTSHSACIFKIVESYGICGHNPTPACSTGLLRRPQKQQRWLCGICRDVLLYTGFKFLFLDSWILGLILRLLNLDSWALNKITFLVTNWASKEQNGRRLSFPIETSQVDVSDRTDLQSYRLSSTEFFWLGGI